MQSHWFVSHIWGMDKVWQGWITPHTTNWPPTTARTCLAVPWLFDPRSWTMDTTGSVVVQGRWYMSRCAIPLFYQCYMRHWPSLKRVNHPTDYSMTSNYSPNMLSCYPGFQNGNPEECTSWYCVPRKMTQVWICYPTVLWASHEASHMFNRSGSPHIP